MRSTADCRSSVRISANGARIGSSTSSRRTPCCSGCRTTSTCWPRLSDGWSRTAGSPSRCRTTSPSRRTPCCATFTFRHGGRTSSATVPTAPQESSARRRTCARCWTWTCSPMSGRRPTCRCCPVTTRSSSGSKGRPCDRCSHFSTTRPTGRSSSTSTPPLCAPSTRESPSARSSPSAVRSPSLLGVDEHLRGGLEVVPQHAVGLRVQPDLVERGAHVGEPCHPRLLVDAERRVPGAKARMTAHLAVGARAAPVLLEEQPQPLRSRLQLVLRVERPEHGVVLDPRVERRDQPSEGLVAADSVVEGGAVDCPFDAHRLPARLRHLSIVSRSVRRYADKVRARTASIGDNGRKEAGWLTRWC